MTFTDDGLVALRELVGADTTFRDGQWDAVSALVADHRRVLCVQRTGWGKSAVYFVATKLLRAHGAGPTLIISPLIALMRNQIERAEGGGVRAARIDSTADLDEWSAIESRINADEIDVLLVSPERFGNAWFVERILPTLVDRVGLFVIDEAHCISDWGHDFRPAYRRITRVLQLLPDGVPVLCTTATANERVVDDVVAQLGDDILVQRGPLARDSLALDVVRLPTQAERLAWLAQTIPTIDGSGIVYTLTIDDARQVAEWLRTQGIDALSYTGADDDGDRIAAEQRLINNNVKVVVATSALGMGYDKPDLAFVIHYQAPGSAVHYYQQVGRAGRALDHACGILLDGDEDQQIIDWFIDMAFPKQADAEAVVALLDNKPNGMKMRELEDAVNVRRSRLDNMLTNLEIDGAIEREKTQYRRTQSEWRYPTERVNGITALRKAEQMRMLEYRRGDGCLMQQLRAELDDHEASTCGRCSHCIGRHLFQIEIDRGLARTARDFLRFRPHYIDARRQWSDGKRIPVEMRHEQGRALSRYGDGGWGTDIRQQHTTGAFSDDVVAALAEMVRVWRPEIGWVTSVASLRHPELVADAAERVARLLNLEFIPAVANTGGHAPQHTMENSTQQHRNVAGAFAINTATAGPIRSEGVLLIDDATDSRWTLTAIAALLRDAGSGPVFPAVFAIGTSE